MTSVLRPQSPARKCKDSQSHKFLQSLLNNTPIGDTGQLTAYGRGARLNEPKANLVAAGWALQRCNELNQKAAIAVKPTPPRINFFSDASA
jgi:hypothetical protein